MRYSRSGEQFPGGGNAEEKESFSPFSGGYCDIDFPGEWKTLSTLQGRTVSYVGQFMVNPLGLNTSTFGVLIAKNGRMG